MRTETCSSVRHDITEVLCFRLVTLQQISAWCIRTNNNYFHKSNKTPTRCNTVQVLFLQGHSTCFGRKRPSSGVSSLIWWCDDLPATITPVPGAAVPFFFKLLMMGAWRPKHVEWLCRNKTCTVLHQVGVLFDLYYDARKHKSKRLLSYSLPKKNLPPSCALVGGRGRFWSNLSTWGASLNRQFLATTQIPPQQNSF